MVIIAIAVIITTTWHTKIAKRIFKNKKSEKMKETGYTVIYLPWEDMEGKPRVAGRFKTEKEKDEFIEKNL